MKQITKWLDRYWWIVAIGAGLLAMAVTLLASLGQSVWFDEGYSILIAREDVSKLLALTGVDAHPPLYYLVLKLWGDLWSFAELPLRGLSALFLGGSITVALLIAKRWFGLRAALVSLPLLVLAPFLLRYGYEIRMYSLATFIGVLATYVLLRAQESKGWKWWAFYAVLVAAGMYTLYMMLAVWLAHAVWLLVVSIKHARSKKAIQKWWRWPWLYAFGGAVLLFAVYAPTALYQFTNSALPGMGKEVTLTVLADMASMVFVYQPGWQVAGWLTLLLLAVLTTAIVAVVVAYRSLGGVSRERYGLLLCLVLVPVLFFALSSLPPREPMFIMRYIAHVVLFFHLLLGVSLGVALGASRKKNKLWVMAGCVVIIATQAIGVVNLGQVGNFNLERMQHAQTKSIVARYGCHPDKTTIIADDPYTYIDVAYYLGACNLRFYSQNDVDFKGGYAPLHQSVARLGTDDAVSSEQLVHIHWGESAQYIPPAGYQRIESLMFDKQYVDVYSRAATAE